MSDVSAGTRRRRRAVVSCCAAVALLALSVPPARGACAGDCDGDGAVTIDELVLLVGIALETIDTAACPAGDSGGDGRIVVAELVAAVGVALARCPASPTPMVSAAVEPPTPTITSTGAATATATTAPATPTTTSTRTATASVTASATRTPSASPTATPTGTATPSAGPLAMPPTIVPNAATHCYGLLAGGKPGNKLGAQLRRSIDELAGCFRNHGLELGTPYTETSCYVTYPGDNGNGLVPPWVDSLVAPNDVALDRALGRVEFHSARQKMNLDGCTEEDWVLVCDWVRYRAQELGKVIPPPCEPEKYDAVGGTGTDAYWWVYEWYEREYLLPHVLDYLHRELRAYVGPQGDLAAHPRCVWRAVEQIGFGVGQQWIAGEGNRTCAARYDATTVRNQCRTNGPDPLIARADWNRWCDTIEARLRPVYEAVRASNGKPCGEGCP